LGLNEILGTGIIFFCKNWIKYVKQVLSGIGKQDRLVIVDKTKRYEVNSKFISALCLGALYKLWYRELGPREEHFA